MERRQAFYQNLPPRRYRFRVVAANNDGVWNDAGAVVDFSIQPAFYQTAWFEWLSGTALIALLWTAYRIRLHQVKAKMHLLFEERLSERTRISRELHDTLLQDISAFALELDGLSKIVAEPKSVQDRLRELRKDAEGWLRRTRESVSDLRSGGAEDRDFIETVRQLGEHLTEGTAIGFRVTGPGPGGPLPAPLREDLLKILQEAIRNAVRHSQATEITADLSRPANDRLRVSIRDNGRGFGSEAESKPGHWGLTTMRERAQTIGAELKLSTSQAGTEIEIDAPTDLDHYE
jgi:signal transduction histidine kinase